MKNLVFILLLLTGALSCGRKTSVPEAIAGVKEAVAKLDSAVTAMYGWEPRDSTYNQAIDSVVLGAANQQETYDEARATWGKFKCFIDADKYEDALNVYFGDGNDSTKNNEGDFLVFLKHSAQRYDFYSQVLWPLMLEYKGYAFAANKYIDILYLEKSLEDGTIAMNAQTTGYVPKVYPSVIWDLGLTLVSVGKTEEALDLFNDLVSGVFGLTGDALFSYFFGTLYEAQLYIKDSKPDMAKARWENFRDYLIEHKADFLEDEVEDILGRIQNAIDKLKANI